MLVLNLGPKDEIARLTFSPTGGMLLASSLRGVALWREIADGARAIRLPSPSFAPHAQFSADGRWLFIGRYELSQFDLATGETVVTPKVTGYQVRFAVSPVEPFVLLGQNAYGAKASQLSLRRTDDIISVGGKVWERDFPAAGTPPRFL